MRAFAAGGFESAVALENNAALVYEDGAPVKTFRRAAASFFNPQRRGNRGKGAFNLNQTVITENQKWKRKNFLYYDAALLFVRQAASGALLHDRDMRLRRAFQAHGGQGTCFSLPAPTSTDRTLRAAPRKGNAAQRVCGRALRRHKKAVGAYGHKLRQVYPHHRRLSRAGGQRNFHTSVRKGRHLQGGVRGLVPFSPCESF